MAGIKLLFSDLLVIFGNKQGVVFLFLIFSKDFISQMLGPFITNILIFSSLIIFLSRVIKKHLLKKSDYKELDKISKEFKKYIKNFKKPSRVGI